MRQIEDPDENLNLIDMMRNIKKFDLLHDHDLREIIKVGKCREYDPGEILIHEGEYDCLIYFLLSGQLEVVKGGKKIGRLMRNGDMFGEMGIIDGSPRSATIRAATRCVVLHIDGAMIEHKFKNNDLSFCYIVYRMFAEVLAVRLRESTEENVQLRKALAKFGAQI